MRSCLPLSFFCDRGYHLKYCIRVFCQCNHRLFAVLQQTHNDAVVYFRIIMGGMIFNCIQMGINSCPARCREHKDHHAYQRDLQHNQYPFKLSANQRTLWFPALGIRGAALATISGTVVACIMSVASIFKKRVFEYSIYIRAAYPPDFVCFSQSDQSCLQCLFRTGINADRFYVNRYYGADQGNGCYGGASGRYEHYGTLLCVWRSAGNGSCLIGRSLDVNDSDLAKRIRPHLSSHRCCHRCLSGCDLLFWCQRSLPSVFTEDHIVAIGVQIMHVIIFVVIFQICQVIYMGCLRGAGDTLYTAVASMISVTFIRTIISYFCGYVLGWGIIGIWMGVLGDQVSRFIFATVRFRRASG